MKQRKAYTELILSVHTVQYIYRRVRYIYRTVRYIYRTVRYIYLQYDISTYTTIYLPTLRYIYRTVRYI